MIKSIVLFVGSVAFRKLEDQSGNLEREKDVYLKILSMCSLVGFLTEGTLLFCNQYRVWVMVGVQAGEGNGTPP